MKFLGRAKKLLQGMAEPSKPRVQFFNVQCPSGHRIRGERTLGYQALRCPGCGEGVFILPMSPLPEPLAPARPAPARPVAAAPTVDDEGPVELTDAAGAADFGPGRSAGNAEAEIIWDDEPPAPAEAAPRPAPPKPDRADAPRDRARRPGTEPKKRKADAGPPREAVPASDRAEPAPVEAHRDREEGRGRGGPRRRGRRPILVFLAVALLVLGTFALRAWRGVRQELPGIYELGRSEGIPALDAGNFDKAHQLLSSARSALDSLGGGLEGADEVRQAADEAAVFVDLLPETLEVMLDEAARMDPQGWADRSRSFYIGHSILVDANVIATPAADGTSRYEIDYVILPPGRPSQFRENDVSKPERTGRIDLSDFQLFQLSPPRVGDHVVFGAKLESFQFDSKLDGWAVRFRPGSGVFITHSKALEGLGWPPEAGGTAERPAAEVP